MPWVKRAPISRSSRRSHVLILIELYHIIIEIGVLVGTGAPQGSLIIICPGGRTRVGQHSMRGGFAEDETWTRFPSSSG